MVKEEFQRELRELREFVASKSLETIELLPQAMKSLVSRDLALANNVIKIHDELDKFEDEVEMRCVRLLALHQPMASDLRFIAGCLKISTDIDRIGHYAVNIAEVTQATADTPHFKPLVILPHMGEIAAAMCRDAVKAFIEGDIELAKGLSKRDDDVDGLEEDILRELLTYMMEDVKKLKQSTFYIMVARYLERVGDHACKIGEKAVYVKTGERIQIK